MKPQRKTTFMFLLTLLLLCSLLVGCGTDTGARSESAQPNPGTIVSQEAAPFSESVSTESRLDDSAGLTVRFLDVGQGDSALIECDGHYMLIDGGGRESSSLIYSVLQSQEITHLDLIMGSHADEDHIGGLSGALNYATADVTLCPVTEYDSKTFASFKKYAEESGNGIQVPEVGDTYELGSADVEILAVNSGSSSNDSSIVTKVTYGQTSFLFTGDAEKETEEYLFNAGTDLTSTVLKVSHHGSNDSSSEEFLKRTAPEYVVISVGADNSYGHPTEAALSRITATGAEILRTDLLGDIIFYSDGTTVSVTTEKNTANSSSAAASPSTENMTQSETSYDDVSYIANTSSKKFHYPSCDSVSKMSEKNKLEFSGTRDELISQGYSPCGSCKP